MPSKQGDLKLLSFKEQLSKIAKLLQKDPATTKTVAQILDILELNTMWEPYQWREMRRVVRAISDGKCAHLGQQTFIRVDGDHNVYRCQQCEEEIWVRD